MLNNRNHHHHQVRVAGEGRSIVLAPWPWRTALLYRSAGEQLESCRTWSSHLFLGRPGRPFQCLLGRCREMRRSDIGGPNRPNELERCRPVVQCGQKLLCVGKWFVCDIELAASPMRCLMSGQQYPSKVCRLSKETTRMLNYFTKHT